MRIDVLVFVALTLIAAPAAAQLTPEQARAKAAKAPVTVAVPDGIWKGRLLDIDAETVTIETGLGVPKTLQLSGVLRIDAKKKDSLVDGAVAGGVTMAAWALIASLTYAAEAKGRGTVIVQNAVTGMVIGGVVDAARSSTVSLYKRPVAQPPRPSPGVFFTVRF